MPPSSRYFRLDVARRVVLVNGRPAKLRARAVDVLVALVERCDRVVSKEDLLDLVWAGRVVEENNLHVHISALRKLFGPEAIVTVPGRGYQFVAATEGLAPAAETVRTALRAEPLLRVLDNREHLSEAVAALVACRPIANSTSI